MRRLTKKMQHILLRSLLVISIFLLSVTAYSTKTWAFKIVLGSDWQLVGESSDLKYYVDKESISEFIGSCSFHRCFPWYGACGCDDTPTRFVRAWIKKISKVPRQHRATEELDYQEYDCIKEKRRFLHLTKLYSDGINESVDLSVLVEWDKIPPDKIAQFLYNYLCETR
jgi:hypothetical protein